MSTKKLLYIGCPYMGENLFGTPCMEILSKEYEITLITPRWSIPIFKEYSFIKHVLPSEGNRNLDLANVRFPESTINSIKEIFSDPTNSYYIVQNDWDIDIFNLYKLDNIIHQRISTLPDKLLDMTISRTKRYLYKMNLMTPEESKNYDCTIRVPFYKKPEKKSEEIVVCQGSSDYLRKLPNEVIKYFVDVVPNAVFLVEKSTAKLLNFENNKIKHIITNPSEEKNLLEVLSLYRSEPKVVIGPDTGLIQLALAYKIPCIWLESRIRIDGIIDYQYKNLITLYRKYKVFCKQDCQSRMYYKQIGGEIFERLPPLVIPDIESRSLVCRDYVAPSCLDFSKEEVLEIISLIK